MADLCPFKKNTITLQRHTENVKEESFLECDQMGCMAYDIHGCFCKLIDKDIIIKVKMK